MIWEQCKGKGYQWLNECVDLPKLPHYQVGELEFNRKNPSDEIFLLGRL